jgi:nucleotide-binding universal stress UspA family protein
MEETIMSKPLNTIVIGTSLTEGSDATVRTGVALAQRTGASLWLVHVYSPLLGTPEMGVDAIWMEEQMKGLRELIDEQARRTGLSALSGFVPGQVHLVLGSPHREIVDLARRVQAGLIVVGATESGPGLLGSTADRVIRKTSCPVLAVRSGAAFPPARVEIPVDFSPISAHALRRGLELLGQLGVSAEETEALFVVNPLEAGGSLHFTPQQIERFAGEVLHRIVAENVPKGGDAPSTRVRTGYPRGEILAAINERKADLAVLGTHGRSGFERLMLGSVAVGVLHGAPCNVLVVPPEAQDTMMDEERSDADWSYVSDEVPAAAGRS